MSQDLTTSNLHTTTDHDISINSAKSRDSKQIYSDDWQADRVRKISNDAKEFQIIQFCLVCCVCTELDTKHSSLY